MTETEALSGMTTAAGRRISPHGWGKAMSGPPLLTSDVRGWRSALVRRWSGTSPLMSQPPLDHHLVVLHLGGPKRVERIGEGGSVTVDVPADALTIVPAGARYEWNTTGPIDFAHLYVSPARFNHALAMTFDRDHSAVALREALGVCDPLLAEVVKAMLAEVEYGSGGGTPYLDRLFDLALAHLAYCHSSLNSVTTHARHALAPMRLRRVLDHVESAIEGPIPLSALAGVAGLSRFHFSRAFRSAMGEPPLAYVTRRRIEAAKRMLRQTAAPLSAVARCAGFATASHFSATFRRFTGQTPSQYRDQL